MMPPARDRHGNVVRVGARVRLLGLSGRWLEELPPEERRDVQSMIGEIFDVEEIDEYGHAWIRKAWPDEERGTCHSHSIAIDPEEMLLVAADAPGCTPPGPAMGTG